MYTVNEIANIAGCGRNTVSRHIKSKFPYVLPRKGIPDEVAREIMASLPKRQMVQLNAPNGASARIDRLESMVEKLCGAVTAMVKARPAPVAQIAMEQDYFSILGYCNKRGLSLKFSDAIRYGKGCAGEKS